MARPTETGLSYFPLDIDFDYDDKFQMISAKYKAEGCWVVIIVLSKIYDDLGYYYQWSEKEQLLTSRRVNSDLITVINVITDAINYGIFDKNKYEKYGVLTSNGIQKRYFEATKKRKYLSVFAEYLINPEITLINPEITLINLELNTQIKGNKIKPEKKKIDKNKTPEYFLSLLPDKLNNDEFIKVWSEWIDYRISKKKTLIESSAKKQIEMLSKQPNPINIINKSILNGWQGLFEEKENGTNNGFSKPSGQKKYEYQSGNSSGFQVIGESVGDTQKTS
jgi:hypothetical protein